MKDRCPRRSSTESRAEIKILTEREKNIKRKEQHGQTRDPLHLQIGQNTRFHDREYFNSKDNGHKSMTNY